MDAIYAGTTCRAVRSTTQKLAVHGFLNRYIRRRLCSVFSMGHVFALPHQLIRRQLRILKLASLLDACDRQRPRLQ